MAIKHFPLTSSIPWRVVLPNTLEKTRNAKIAWCRSNAVKGSGIAWIAPELKNDWIFGADEYETWYFRDQELATMFELTWAVYA